MSICFRTRGVWRRTAGAQRALPAISSAPSSGVRPPVSDCPMRRLSSSVAQAAQPELRLRSGVQALTLDIGSSAAVAFAAMIARTGGQPLGISSSGEMAAHIRGQPLGRPPQLADTTRSGKVVINTQMCA
ncbi:hypothetical protein OH77DRAFT_1061610 [Trametes cingulata]|nr:hypothetical protein OH77DRAFT_1061610 [Trametes cingulata]